MPVKFKDDVKRECVCGFASYFELTPQEARMPKGAPKFYWTGVRLESLEGILEALICPRCKTIRLR